MIKKILKHKITSGFVIFILLVALGASVFFGWLQFSNSQKIAFGLSVGGQKIGGLEFGQAKRLLNLKNEELKEQPIVFSHGEKQWQFTIQELGVSFDEQATFDQALIWGRKKNAVDLFKGIREQFSSWIFKENLPAVYRLDEEKFDAALAELSPLEKPAQNARYVYDPEKKSVDISAQKEGVIVDRLALKSGLLKNLGQFENKPIGLILKNDVPTVSAADLKNSEKEAILFLEKTSLVLKSGVQSWPIEKTELAQWLSLDPNRRLSLDQKEIENFLSQIALAINTEPINAKLTFADEKIKVFAISSDGKNLNIPASAQKITAELLAGKQEIELKIDSVKPEISTETIDNLGLTSLLGKGESDFAGSPKNRQYNIALGTSKMNGILVKPGEEFSFAQSIGPIDYKNGWLPELVIKGKLTIPEAGGGVCQVSTTLFRAAINSGLKITERFPHAYAVKYYNPQGFDATVYPPKPDLKFLNDTPSYILLQAKIEGTKLFFEIYGTADGREVKVIGPKTTWRSASGAMRTTLAQQIWRDGALEREDQFPSNYRSPNPAASPSPSPSPSPLASPAPSPTPTAPPTPAPSPAN